ncbi:MAG: hypothetical protein LBU83_08445 [Bacteroidales bacterium]|jgi:hypothetical protein|nr:hypothetical protein [Bacteroidales bacterium]
MEETKEQILRNIREDYNHYTAFEIKKFLTDEVIFESELLKVVEGDTEVVEAIYRYSNPILERNTNQTPNRIKDYCTEIYLWGLPSAGKTWALAGILNTIDSEGHLKLYGKNDTEQCISSDYMNGLLNVINNRKAINYLPNKTSNETIRYMNFKLLKDGEERKVAFIDLSGELVKAIANENVIKNHKELEKERKLLESLLSNRNRKIHFFFIDYARNDDEGGKQNIHFSNLCSIFNSKRYFEKNTDFIYIVVTKADMIDSNEAIRKNEAIKYFNKYYKSFRNNLGKICQDNEINFGDDYEKGDYSFLDDYILDFSIGEVLFLRMCRFNKKSSLKIVDILQEKIQKERSGKAWIFG